MFRRQGCEVIVGVSSDLAVTMRPHFGFIELAQP
jgi:hypothetical protein